MSKAARTIVSRPGDLPSSTAEQTLEGDRALLSRFRAGDQAALAEVFRMYAHDVARTIRRGVTVTVDGGPVRVAANPSEFEVEDLVQETFLRAFGESARQRYDGIRPFGAYIATIAKNLIIDRGRRGQTERATMNKLREIDSAPAMDDADGVTHAHELSAVVERFQRSLDEKEALVYGYRYLEGHSLRKTAKLVGESVFNLRKIDVGVRTRLLEELRSAGFFLGRDVKIGDALMRRSKREEP